eukprot:TRINITY_DN33531_c0_g1_i1.p1 TRINITY_DN33531_c0_g1~~TRINITY_DN33531_c0_g1_i1.p1  ORF type:complete len:516 (+),score=120.05 TRINITY_DN33531_c0_g1_i1:102-1649(+)
MCVRAAAALAVALSAPAAAQKNATYQVPCPDGAPPPADGSTAGLLLLSQLGGVYSGALNSQTALGSYPKWPMDIRAITGDQVSGRSELDTRNDIYMTWFVTEGCGGGSAVIFRNGGLFASEKRISYMALEEERHGQTESYYRFVDLGTGASRLVTEMWLATDGSTMHMRTATNDFGTAQQVNLHFDWSTRRLDAANSDAAKTKYGLPAPNPTVRKLGISTGQPAIYFSDLTSMAAGNARPLKDDPFPDSAQPTLGSAALRVVGSEAGCPAALVITTRPMMKSVIPGGPAVPDPNLESSISRFVASEGGRFTFTLLHPGTYYATALSLPANSDAGAVFAAVAKQQFVGSPDKQFAAPEGAEATVCLGDDSAACTTDVPAVSCKGAPTTSPVKPGNDITPPTASPAEPNISPTASPVEPNRSPTASPASATATPAASSGAASPPTAAPTAAGAAAPAELGSSDDDRSCGDGCIAAIVLGVIFVGICAAGIFVVYRNRRQVQQFSGPGQGPAYLRSKD